MRYLLLSVLMSLFLTSFGQYSTKKKSAIKVFEQGRQAYTMMDFQNAELLLKDAIEKDENFIEAHLFLARVYFETKRYPEALGSFENVVQINPNYQPLLYLKIGTLQLKLAQYEKGEQSLLRFRSMAPDIPEQLRDEYNLLLATSRFGAKAIKNPVPFEPVNLGKGVNTQYDDYHPSITVDAKKLVYTGKDPVRVSQSGATALREDLYYSNKSGGVWQSSFNFGPPINSKYNNEGSSSISHDGSKLFFTACNKEDGFGSCDLYLSKITGGKWGAPGNLGNLINSKAWDSHPSLSPDGRTLYWSSGRPGGKGGADLWRCTMDENGRWGKPENLEINTKGSDMTPYVHADGKTLFFSSNGRPGMGGHDIFVVQINDDGSFGTVRNVGYPINTSLEEYGMIADPEGRMAFYASEMEGGYGGLDLYQFELPESIRPTLTKPLSGVVFDRDSKKKLSARVELIDLQTGKLAASTTSDKIDGKFLAALPSERDYALNVSCKGYLFYSENFSLKGKKAEAVELKVPLVAVKTGEKVVLKNVFFETAKFDLKPESEVELNKLVYMLKSNPEMNIEIGGHTDDVGDPAKNKILSENRAKAVMQFLVDRGIDESRLTSKGYGADVPVAENDSEEGRAQNRRTEFKVLN